jgi:hypothetical protein
MGRAIGKKTAGKPYSVVMDSVQAMQTVDDLLPLHPVRDQGKAMLLFAPKFLLAYYPQCRQTPFSWMHNLIGRFRLAGEQNCLNHLDSSRT